MKKIWKNLCVCSMAVVSAFSLWACGKPAPEVSVDLDGDGVISAWENIYQRMENSTRDLNAEVVEISTLDGLKAINDDSNSEESTSKVYKLTRDINCNGETLAINLGTSKLLGNNKVIKNFKLGDCVYKEKDSEDNIQANIKGLFYNGIAIYDLRIFLGNQVVTVNNTYSESVVSPFINVANIENIEVRGKLTIDRQKIDGLSANNSFDVSLLNANLNEIIPSDIEKGLSIRNVTLLGQIVYTEGGNTNTKVRIGSAIPYASKGGMVYNVSSNVDIIANSSGTIMIGGIAGESDDLISTCTTNGEIRFSYFPNFNSKIGGIVGSNNVSGEVKNCTSNNTINFNFQEITSAKSDMYVGGIAGCNYGIMSYITSESNMNISGALSCTIGGIAGYSQNAIINNIISRGSINCTSVNKLNVSEMVGMSQGGYYYSAIVTTNVTIDNANINSVINLGMITIFEDLESTATYNAEYSPNFRGILVGSKNIVYAKPTTSSNTHNTFRYNLGLRNPYAYVVTDENGTPVTEIRKDQYGAPILDEEGNEIYDEVTATQLPDVYTKLFYTSGYSIEKYDITGDTKMSIPITYTYAKDTSNASIVSECSNSRLLVNFFVRNLGFKYGLNHSEIDLTDLSLDKIKFTLDENEHKVKFFEELSYNGELSYFDKYLDKACLFDARDEMYSIIYNLFTSEVDDEFIPLKVSNAFAVSNKNSSIEIEDNWDDNELEDESNPFGDSSSSGGSSSSGSDTSEEDEEIIDMSLNLYQNFGENIRLLIKDMLGINPKIELLANNKVNIDDIPEENVKVKYIRITLSDAKFRYYFTFDVTEMVDDETESKNSYIVYFHYKKVSKLGA